MAQGNFWSGFAAGAAAGALAGVAGVLVFRRRMSDVDSRVVRLERSINVGRPVNDVFAAWSQAQKLPRYISFVESVEQSGDRSHWRVNIDGRRFEWDALITQSAANQSIGWKSLTGPHHTGRITFAPLGEQTVVHVLMNYEPPMGGLIAMVPMETHLEQWIERGLREFKSSLERERVPAAGASQPGSAVPIGLSVGPPPPDRVR
jgi:uncharacterized membrane protein